MAKLVELLARELVEWPTDGFKVKYLTQDGDGWIASWENDGPLFFSCDNWKIADSCPVDQLTREELAEDYKESVVTRAQWQAERDRQKGGEWKRHRGGKQPVADDVRVEVKLRDGDTQEAKASAFLWNHSDCDVYANIMQYRVISQPQAEEVEVKDTTIGTLIYKVEIDTTEAAQAIDELAAKWGQLDGPLKWRDGVAELEAYIEEFTRQRDDLVKLLESEGFALIPHNTPVQGFSDQVDMQDWRNWKAGDIVQCVTTPDMHGGYYTKCSEYSIAVVDLADDMYPVDVTCDSGFSLWCPSHSFKFIRRP